jgi:anti-sigma regulatory factor (Ser/Thr protein kinase)
MDGAAGSGTHRALIAASDDELVTGTDSFVCAGLDAGAPVVLACTDQTAELLQKSLADRPQLVWAEWGDVYGNGPAAAITAVRRLGERYRTPENPLVRVVLEPFAGPDPDTWREWQRYDAVLDHQLEEAEALGDEPLDVLCLCDTRRVPGPLVDAARATHPMLQVDGEQVANPDHVDAAEYLISMPVPAEPLEGTPPLVRADSVRDLRGLRRDLAARAADASLPAGSEPALEDFLLAVDEMTTNALRHGRPPVDLRLWADEKRLVCTVTDRGAGLQDPFIGYGPAHGDDLSLGGMGLWLARQLCDHVDITGTPDGVRVRLTTALY